MNLLNKSTDDNTSESIDLINRSDLVTAICLARPKLAHKLVDHLVKQVFAKLAMSIANNERVEIRGFGSFSVKQRASSTIRNPQNGCEVKDSEPCYVIRFKPGRDLRKRVDN